jgi:hypothetical protein
MSTEPTRPSSNATSEFPVHPPRYAMHQGTPIPGLNAIT